MEQYSHLVWDYQLASLFVFIFDNTNDFSDLSAKKKRGDGASQKSDYIGATFQQISW